MQKDKKIIVYNAIAKTIKRLRGNKSQYVLSGEYDIPQSVLSKLEQGTKDPQLTTLLKLAGAFDLSFPQFASELEKDLPENFTMLDD